MQLPPQAWNQMHAPKVLCCVLPIRLFHGCYTVFIPANMKKKTSAKISVFEQEWVSVFIMPNPINNNYMQCNMEKIPAAVLT